MAKKKSLKSDQELEEKMRIMQDVIACDNMLNRLEGDPVLSPVWAQKKNDLEFKLSQLNTDEL